MKKSILIGAVSSLCLLAGITSASTTNTNNSTQSLESAQPTVVEPAKTVEPVIETKEEVETVSIAYQTAYYDDNTLSKGSTKVITEGVNGTKSITYRVTYTDGKETNREIISEEVITQPVNKVVANGTYEAPAQPQTTCTNGTYVNSAGSTACRPSSDNTGGATAICKDGTYSYSQSRSGTCSHHGGVKTWL